MTQRVCLMCDFHRPLLLQASNLLLYYCHSFMVTDAVPVLSQGCAAPAQLFLRTNQTAIPKSVPPILLFSEHIAKVAVSSLP